MKPALIIIDIQNEFIPRMSEQEKKYAFDIINGSIWFFRQNNLPIIRIYHSDLKWGPNEGDEGFNYPESVIIKESDLKIIKHYPSAFTKTKLDSTLRKLDCNTLFLCGLSATMCVFATYFGGQEFGYKTFLIKDGVMSHNPEYTNVINDICNSMNFDSMIYILQNAP
jgi:nicotinamidase-related amidase